MMQEKKPNTRRLGQAIGELAVFGSILVFLIGGIVRSAVQNSYQQNNQLKAMRQALQKSVNSRPGVAGHNTASVLYIEDRLSPDPGKYGASDRVQLFTQGSGTMTNLLMFPLDEGELSDERNVPVVDLYVNGVYFPLTTARMVNKTLSPPDGYPNVFVSEPGGRASTPVKNNLSRYKGWEFRCICSVDDKGDTEPKNDVETCYGCPILYELSTKPETDYGMLTDKEAYDLNRNDDFTDDPQITAGNGKVARKDVYWHWKGILGLTSNIDIDVGNNNYPSYDIDNDKQDETIYRITGSSDKGVVSSLMVLDRQEGDFNATSSDLEGGVRSGLQLPAAIYTRTKEGTYLQIKDGKLYNPESGVIVRSASRRNQVELVQRMFQLSSDTGRFCDGAGSPRASLIDGIPNPVEVCGKTDSQGHSTCLNQESIKLTCFDQDTKMLFIRSRILDKIGNAWKTDIGNAKLP